MAVQKGDLAGRPTFPHRGNGHRRPAGSAVERRRIEVTHGHVDRLLARAGTNRTSLARVPGPRYERTSPIELWHIDLKGPF